MDRAASFMDTSSPGICISNKRKVYGQGGYYGITSTTFDLKDFISTFEYTKNKSAN